MFNKSTLELAKKASGLVTTAVAVAQNEISSDRKADEGVKNFQREMNESCQAAIAAAKVLARIHKNDKEIQKKVAEMNCPLGTP